MRRSRISQGLNLNALNALNACVSERMLKMFTTISFDIARDALITPRRLMYVRTKEIELFDNLSGIANKKQEEIEKIIQETVDAIREPLLDEAEAYRFQSKNKGRVLRSKKFDAFLPHHL